MNKRGDLIVIVAVFLIVFTGIGVYAVYDASNTLYVGDSKTQQYLDYFECEDVAKNISDENLIVFKSLDEAISSKYQVIEGCV